MYKNMHVEHIIYLKNINKNDITKITANDNL